MNTVQLIGRTGKDCEMRYFESGNGCKSETSLAVDRFVKGEKVTDWYDIRCFGKTAEFLAEHARKGKQIGVSGTLEYDYWENKETKKREKRLWVTVNNVTLLGGKDKESD